MLGVLFLIVVSVVLFRECLSEPKRGEVSVQSGMRNS